MAKSRAHGEGSITWDASVQRWVGRLPRDERGRRAKVSGKTPGEAQRKLRDKLREREQGIDTDAGRLTLGAFLERWLADVVMPSELAQQTKNKREINVRLHILPGLGRVKLAKLTPMQVQRWVNEELAAGKGVPTVQSAHSTLRSALELAVLWGVVARNVARLVKSPKQETAERRPFTAPEQAAILRAAKSDRLYVMVVLAHATGLRQSELLGLQWEDIDLNSRLLDLRRQLGRNQRFKRVKTAVGRRMLPLPSPVVAVLSSHRAEQDEQRSGAEWWEDHDLVICTRNGRPVNQRNAHRSWTRLLALADVEHRGIHHMRHAYVTALAEQGVHERVAQQLAGHADGRTTRDVYTHVTHAMAEGAAAAVERAVSQLYPDSEPNGSSNGSSFRERDASGP